MDYKTLANKGRYGDSELRNVAGRKSHVNPREADLIDLWGSLGESLVQRDGAGTRNPKTGMPEYHEMPLPEDTESNFYKISLIHNDDLVDGTHQTTELDEYGGPKIDYQAGLKKLEEGTLGEPPDSTWDDMEYSGDLASIITDIVGEGSEYDPRYDFDNDGKISLLDIIAASEVHGGTGELEMELTPFDPYTEGEFTPDKDEFQQYVETGNIDELIAGFGGDWTESDFADIMEMDELGFLQEGYGLQTGKLESDKTITGDILQSNLDTAKGQYGRGLQTAGYNVGKSLFDVKQQVEGQQSKGGFAGSGFVAATGKRFKRGLFQDYRAQQRELSAGLGEAKTAFAFGTQRMESDYQYGMDTARLGLETDIYDFWSGKYEDFYDRLYGLESGTIYGT